MPVSSRLTPTIRLYLTLLLAWGGCALFPLFFFLNRFKLWPMLPFFLVGCAVWLGFMVQSHVKRVRAVCNRVDEDTLANRHRRQLELPIGDDAAYTLVEEILRELPHNPTFQNSRPSLTLLATVERISPYGGTSWDGSSYNRVEVRVEGNDGCSTVHILCEPDSGVWYDWFALDGASNLETAEIITRNITRRVAELRRAERDVAERDALQKELAYAKLSVLEAQVEPHFLYNTLASAQLLTRSDPVRADAMLGHLINYLRCSLLPDLSSPSPLAAEIARAEAYLEIMRVRMGSRLRADINVAEPLRECLVPQMMLQTLVENAIKHGLEPKTGGGTIWISARQEGGQLVISVADDGIGLSGASSGTGVGLRNLRERLALLWADQASFSLQPNFPQGMTAVLSLPCQTTRPTPSQSNAAKVITP